MTNRVLRNVLYLPPLVISIYHMRQNRALLIKRSQICRSRIALFVNSSVYDPIAKLGDTIAIIFTIIISLQLLRATTRALQKTVLKTLILV